MNVFPVVSHRLVVTSCPLLADMPGPLFLIGGGLVMVIVAGGFLALAVFLVGRIWRRRKSDPAATGSAHLQDPEANKESQ